jgi:hypothetical protein
MSGKNFTVLLVSLLTIGVALAITLSHERPPTIGTPYETFRAQRTIWLSRRPADYDVSIDRRCFCPPYSARVNVSGAKVERLELLNSPRNSVDFADGRFYPRDVDSLLKIVDEAYASRAYKIEVTFDVTYGYPTKVFIDRDRDTVDDEDVFELSNFEARHVG